MRHCSVRFSRVYLLCVQELFVVITSHEICTRYMTSTQFPFRFSLSRRSIQLHKYQVVYIFWTVRYQSRSCVMLAIRIYETRWNVRIKSWYQLMLMVWARCNLRPPWVDMLRSDHSSASLRITHDIHAISTHARSSRWAYSLTLNCLIDSW